MTYRFLFIFAQLLMSQCTINLLKPQVSAVIKVKLKRIKYDWLRINERSEFSLLIVNYKNTRAIRPKFIKLHKITKTLQNRYLFVAIIYKNYIIFFNNL